ncbi:hypothetical protein [Flavivirga rizhaonensis]|uniref:Lipocalin-like domain-containing protein n=1 Tax=Flavivirga rizhaonensis TaxID=2559571 RepID=A0A4S1DSZ2_9FLAO|nr:hypothetical protein [Flavivirga rizhaonensis]TGV00492.1 hypothetical protein EM932_19540 [Flavivirga rizhaonensis]
MKSKIIILIGILIFIVACSNDDNFESKINGRFTGTFDRNGNISNVELNFENGTFSGSSEIIKFPAICSGKYNRIGFNKIEFINECPWTAEFDWSLILGGVWNYTFNENELTLIRYHSDNGLDNTEDKYILQKIIE